MEELEKTPILIYYKKSKRNFWLGMGIVSLIITILSIIYAERDSFFFNPGLFMFYTLWSAFNVFKPFIKITNEHIWVSTAPFRKIKISEIEKIKYYLDEITITANGKKLLFSDQNIAEEDQHLLKEILKPISERTNLVQA